MAQRIQNKFDFYGKVPKGEKKLVEPYLTQSRLKQSVLHLGKRSTLDHQYVPSLSARSRFM